MEDASQADCGVMNPSGERIVFSVVWASHWPAAAQSVNAIARAGCMFASSCAAAPRRTRGRGPQGQLCHPNMALDVPRLRSAAALATTVKATGRKLERKAPVFLPQEGKAEMLHGPAVPVPSAQT